jgi:hypothetical protein
VCDNKWIFKTHGATIKISKYFVNFVVVEYDVESIHSLNFVHCPLCRIDFLHGTFKAFFNHSTIAQCILFLLSLFVYILMYIYFKQIYFC